MRRAAAVQDFASCETPNWIGAIGASRGWASNIWLREFEASAPKGEIAETSAGKGAVALSGAAGRSAEFRRTRSRPGPRGQERSQNDRESSKWPGPERRRSTLRRRFPFAAGSDRDHPAPAKRMANSDPASARRT